MILTKVFLVLAARKVHLKSSLRVLKTFKLSGVNKLARFEVTGMGAGSWGLVVRDSARA